MTEAASAGSLENTTTATTMEVNITSTEAPYNGEESENRLEGVDNFSNMTNMTSEIMSNITSQFTISDQADATKVRTHKISMYSILIFMLFVSCDT